MHAYEFKRKAKGPAAFPKTFTRAYPETEGQNVDLENYDDFLLEVLNG